MTKNALGDVHDHLVARLEELSKEDMTQEELDNVVRRAKASCEVAREIGTLGRLALDAEELLGGRADYANGSLRPMPAMLTATKTTK